MTGRSQMTAEEREGVVTVVLHLALFDAFVSWLDSRSLDLSPPIPADDGSTFRVVTPRSLGPLPAAASETP